MKRRCKFAALILGGLGLSLAASAAVAQQGGSTFLGRPAPEGFIPPFLDPTDVKLETKQLASGVYGLFADKRPVNNNGFVVGDRGVLVIDAHINADMAKQTMDAVAAVTDKPILYLVNANYHGDHTFGNYAFPADTQIIAHTETARHMRQNLEQRKNFMLPAVWGNSAVYEQVEPRMPDILFDDFMQIDLGGIVVEIHHFGPGNTSGDTVVYAPGAKVVWTGNLIVGEGALPPIFQGNARQYLSTIAKLKASIPVATIVPGHGQITTSKTVDRFITYIGALVDDLEGAIVKGMSLDEAYAAFPLDRYYVMPEHVPDRTRAFISGLHKLNVQRSYMRFTEQRS